ncbi:MAG: hypothetical protein WCW14_03315 [Candidatus Paceibacterota bacterium]
MNKETVIEILERAISRKGIRVEAEQVSAISLERSRKAEEKQIASEYRQLISQAVKYYIPSELVELFDGFAQKLRQNRCGNFVKATGARWFNNESKESVVRANRMGVLGEPDRVSVSYSTPYIPTPGGGKNPDSFGVVFYNSPEPHFEIDLLEDDKYVGSQDQLCQIADAMSEYIVGTRSVGDFSGDGRGDRSGSEGDKWDRGGTS